MYKKFNEILDSKFDTIKIKTKYDAVVDFSVYFFPNGEPFDEKDYEEIITYYIGLTRTK